MLSNCVKIYPDFLKNSGFVVMSVYSSFKLAKSLLERFGIIGKRQPFGHMEFLARPLVIDEESLDAIAAVQL